MSRPLTAADAPPPEFHAASSALRFWVLTDAQQWLGASVSTRVLHHRFQGLLDGSDAQAVYAAHRELLDATVLRRAAAGSREPVMLRESDLPLAPR